VAEDMRVAELPTGPVAVAGFENLGGLMADCLLDWPLRPPRPGDPAPAIAVLPDAVVAPVLPDGRSESPDPLFLANALAGALTAQIPLAEPAWVQLHAAAALGPAGRLELFLGASGAGKSTLGLTLLRAGWRLFADDRLAVRLDGAGPEAMALGVAPKLRLPPPPELAADAAWLDARAGLRRPGLLYLRPGPQELARLGARAPLARLIVLDRTAGPGRAGLAPLAPAEALRALLPQCFAPGLPAGALLAWAQRLVAQVPALRLSYDAAGQAAAVLGASEGSAA
jgi:hypothetical protein